MDVTILDADLPWPANSGKRLRTLNLMLPLAARHRITYIARCRFPEEREPAERFLREHGIRPIIVEEPVAPKSGPKFYAGIAANLASSLPYAAAIHYSRGLEQAVRAHAASTTIDLMQIEWEGLMYCHQGLDCPVVLQAHNVESLIWKRYAQTERSLARRAYSALQYRKFLQYEARQFAAADRVVAVSEADAALARSLYGSRNISVVENGVAVAEFKDLAPATSSRQILFLGSMDWRPNVDAVQLLLTEILPALRRRVPDATLAVVGRNPTPALRQALAEAEGATLFADVPDVRPYLTGSAVMAVPLRIGGGSRLKILESLAAGLPVVSTTIGAEGLELRHGHDLVIADGTHAFADALAQTLLDPQCARAQGEVGRRTVAARYDWTMISAALESVWIDAAAGLGRGDRDQVRKVCCA